RKIPRSGRRAGLQSNKELIINLDTPNPHVSNPEPFRRGSLIASSLLLAMTGYADQPECDNNLRQHHPTNHRNMK
ncbi:hypothetical protein, partial [Bradyrhizobium sp. 147]|uniref:hypothetical protein n=1 Tax=Bradyrhizobium sp. 147 TaxID=2782623 RepID=UPI001FF95FB1